MALKEFKNKYNLLIVDDDAMNTLILSNILKKDDYNLLFASDGYLGLRKIEENEIDLVLLDISMPDIDGYEVCRRIKSNPKFESIPIIFITASEDQSCLRKAFNLGAVDYITKPFYGSEIQARVETHLELKGNRDHLKRIKVMLEQKVEERTLELKDANEKLMVLDRAKSDFLTLISHELRTPLNGIKNYAEILQETVQDEESKEFLEYLMDSSNRLIKFSESALLVTALKAEKIKVEKVKCSVIDLFEKTFISKESMLLEKSLDYKLEYDNVEAIVEMDEELTLTCIENLIDNAIKYSPTNGAIKVEISNYLSLLEIKIKDQGPGIGKHYGDDLFDSFVNKNVMNHSEGFGLGLAAVKLILDIHGGKISISNGQDSGAEVKILLPIAPVNDSQQINNANRFELLKTSFK